MLEKREYQVLLQWDSMSDDDFDSIQSMPRGLLFKRLITNIENENQRKRLS